MTNYTFAQFLRDQINEKADGSQRKFSLMSNVSNAAISRLLDAEKNIRPELDTLEKISTVTNTNLITLINLAYPDGVFEGVSPTAQIVASEFDKLPTDLQSAIIAMMRGSKAKR